MPRGRCLACQYDLSNTPEAAGGEAWQCPECGRFNTRSEMTGDDGWPAWLVRGIVLGLLMVVNLAAVCGVGVVVEDVPAAQEIAMVLCLTELSVLTGLAYVRRRRVSWVTVIVFAAVLLGATGIGVKSGTWVAGRGVVPPMVGGGMPIPSRGY